MEVAELAARVTRFMRVHLNDSGATVVQLVPGPGHAGFSYRLEVHSREGRHRYFLRLPPPNVKWEGPADVLRQVWALQALAGSAVPHVPVLWWGDDLRWFGSPYFIQPWVDGDVLRGDYVLRFTADQRREMARQAMEALAHIHRIPWRELTGRLGVFQGLETEVTRWDRFAARAAEPQLLDLQPKVRQKLLEQLPADANIGLCHGDFNWANLLFTEDGILRAVIDWELTQIGPTLTDVGWICLFSDPQAWAHPREPGIASMPSAEELEVMYRDTWGSELRDLRWFKAFAAYKFGIITGFNLMLHRRGKRTDPHWEVVAPSMRRNMEYALELLTD